MLFNPPLDYGLPGTRLTRTTIDFSAAAWNSVASHRVFTVTGIVRAFTIFHVEEVLTSTSTISFGYTVDITAYAPAQAAAGLLLGAVIQPGGTFFTTVLRTWNNFATSAQYADVICVQNNIGYALNAGVTTDGTIEAYCYWTPINRTANVESATGGAM